MNYANALFKPIVGDCYAHGWKMLWKNFLELLLIGIIAALISIPIIGLSLLAGESFIENHISLFIIPVIVYGIFVLSPLHYGVYYAFLKAVREENLQIRDMFAFTQNYWNAILANLLTSFIVFLGILILIIPGIYFACKLAFVPYLVIDRKMEAIEAIKESWKMTDGYVMTIFLMGLLSFIIVIAGMILFFVGVFIAYMWIYSAFSAIYYSVDTKLHPVAERTGG